MNKNIDKNSYKEASYGRKQLTITSIVILILSILALVGGIVLIVNGILHGKVVFKVLKIIGGSILTLLGLAFTYASFMALMTSLGMLKNNSMNVKDGNRAIGTLNIFKCDKCGCENEENAKFCKQCGASFSEYVECECGTRNPVDAEFCKSCGKKLK